MNRSFRNIQGFVSKPILAISRTALAAGSASKPLASAGAAVVLLMAALLAATGSGSALAAVTPRDWKTPGDGLLTYDDVNQREWLDLTETQLFKFPGNSLEEQYQAVIAKTAGGGVFEEFTPAASEQVFGLAESAGLDVTTLDFAVNEAAADNLIELLGNPIPAPVLAINGPPDFWTMALCPRHWELNSFQAADPIRPLELA